MCKNKVCSIKKKEIEVCVPGQPPKKDSGMSLYTGQKEVIDKLKQKVDELLRTKEIKLPFEGLISLKIEVYLPQIKILQPKKKSRPDLDNMIGGICDALQGCSRSTVVPKQFVIVDDSQIVEITAKFIPLDTDDEYYKITVTEL